MRYVAAYLLAVLGGNKKPSKSDLEKILGSIGLEIDDERADKVLSELNGKDIETVISEGMGKLASIPSGGAAVASSGGSGGTSGGDGGAEEKKEEAKKEESEEESDDDMGFGLFD